MRASAASTRSRLVARPPARASASSRTVGRAACAGMALLLSNLALFDLTEGRHAQQAMVEEHSHIRNEARYPGQGALQRRRRGHLAIGFGIGQPLVNRLERSLLV